MSTMFGPAYPKINSLWKRDRDNKNIVLPGMFAQEEFSTLKDAKWEWTEKIDGMNIRLHRNGFGFSIGGRTDNAQIPANLLDALMKVADEEIADEVFGADTDFTLYGEGYGPKIQRNGGGYREDPGFILFDVRVGDVFLSRESVVDISVKFGIPVVKTLAICSITDAWQEMWNGELKSTYPDHELEGIVGRPVTRLYTNKGHGFEPLLCKIKYADIQNWHKHNTGGVVTVA